MSLDSNRPALDSANPKADRSRDKKEDPVASRSVFNLRSIVATCLLAALSGDIRPKANIDDTREAVKVTQTQEKNEQSIQKIENDYDEFGTTLKQRIEAIKNEYLKKLILGTFDKARTNRTNIYKNDPSFTRDLPKDFKGFSYHFLDPQILDGDSAAARFTGPMRIVQLNASFDPQNIFDLFTLMHELVHAEQDDDDRKDKKTKAEYIDKAMHLSKEDNVRKESEARACEIELANAYLEGKLESTFKNRPITSNPKAGDPLVQELMTKFNAGKNQEQKALNLIGLAMVYYSEGGAQEEKLPANFTKDIGDYLIKQ